MPVEREALDRRYQEALRDAVSRGAEVDIGRFEAAVATSTFGKALRDRLRSLDVILEELA